MSVTPYKAAIATAAAALMLASGASGALAKGGHGRHHGFGLKFHSLGGHHHRHRNHDIYFYNGGGGCGYYYDRWMSSGRFYWKSKYYQCKGWW